MMKLSFYLFLFTLIGCSSTQRIRNDHYSAGDFQLLSLSFFPVSADKIYLHNPQDLIDDFPEAAENPESKMSQLLLSSICMNSKKYLENISFISTVTVDAGRIDHHHPGAFIQYDAAFKKGNRKSQFRIPSEPTLDVLGMDSDVIVVIDDIDFKRVAGSAPEWTGEGQLMTPGTGSLPMLTTDVKYIFWHRIDQVPVCYGQIEVETVYSFGLTADTWQKHLSHITEELYKGTPFRYVLPLPEGKLNK